MNVNDERILISDPQNRFHTDSQTGVLSILNTMRDDSGTYECLAQNILGSAHARTTLLVRRKYLRKERSLFVSIQLFLRTHKNCLIASNNENCQSTIISTRLSCIQRR